MVFPRLVFVTVNIYVLPVGCFVGCPCSSLMPVNPEDTVFQVVL